MPAVSTHSPAQASEPRRAAAPPAALYQQIKDHVVRKIAEGSWQPGDRVPSEQDMVAQFGMSRMTVNRALRELAEQGSIRRVAGVGSFVAEEKPQSTLLQIANVADEIRARGHDHRCTVLSLARESATMEIAAALGLRTGESVFHSMCVHYEDQVPVQLEDRFVNPSAAPDFMAQDFTRQPPAEYLLRNVPLDEIEHVVDAILPTAEQARLLAMDPHQPCLMLTRRTWMREQPVTFVRCIHPGMRYRLGSRFRADGKPAVG